jgi:hypothetical protein
VRPRHFTEPYRRSSIVTGLSGGQVQADAQVGLRVPHVAQLSIQLGLIDFAEPAKLLGIVIADEAQRPLLGDVVGFIDGPDLVQLPSPAPV